ncbi:MAG TPA: hypothetical protein VJR47_10650 [Stellaceae bacterium]|nr:hypothetical protein [Stellaceae bacterium]
MNVLERQANVAVLTTPQLRADLQEIEHLIGALGRIRHADPSDLDDLNWLRGRRRYVLALLAARRAQKGRKVIRLDLWRDGGMSVAARSRAA